MTTDVKLLPLPEPKVQHDALGGLYLPLEVSDYARANMAELLAENERLRGEWLKALGLSMQAQAEAKELRGACDVYQARAERLAEAGRRVTAAFRALGETTAWTRSAEQARHECEAAMLALDAALDQEGGR